MEHESGDAYVRRIAAHIRANEPRLAESGPPPRRRPRSAAPTPGSVYNPVSWFAASAPADNRPKALTFSIDTVHLFYLLVRMEAVGLDVGSLDVRVEHASRPMSYAGLPAARLDADVLSLTSIRTSLSAVSRLSLGAPFWGRAPPKPVDDELRYIYSAFTKLPALALSAPTPSAPTIAELANEPPNANALPLDAFKNLQVLAMEDIDPRTILGWDRLADKLWSLSIKRSGLDDISDLFISAVLDDAARRAGQKPRRPRRRRSVHGGAASSRQSSARSARVPASIDEGAEEAEDAPEPAPEPEAEAEPELPSGKWASLVRLDLSHNALTFLPTAPFPYFSALAYLNLSANLLVSVPDGLSALYSLQSLDLSDNMIDSVLGIYKRLGSVTTLNLAHNRLDCLAGLERLLALARVDVRGNLLDDAGEAGRLAPLPHIAELSVAGNPFTELEPDARVRVFELFWAEGRELVLDGAPAGFYERRARAEAPAAQMNSTRPLSIAGAAAAPSPPFIAVGSPRARSPPPSAGTGGGSGAGTGGGSGAGTPSSSGGPSPALLATKHKRRKPKRIVDLDAGAAASLSPPPSATAEPAPQPASSPPPAATRPKPRHRRSATASADLSPSPPPSPPPVPSTIGRGTARKKSRAARVSASVFEPHPPAAGTPEAAREHAEHAEAEAFRRRIEALRSDVGEGWLKMFAEGQQQPVGGAGSGR